MSKIAKYIEDMKDDNEKPQAFQFHFISFHFISFQNHIFHIFRKISPEFFLQKYVPTIKFVNFSLQKYFHTKD